MAAGGMHFMSLAEARRKCTEKHSCFHQIEHKEHICLPPSYVGKLKQGINEELSQKLMKFCEKLQAVVVAYDKIQLLQPSGSIVEESPFLHFDAKVNYIVFKPEVDSKLVGVVNKFGYDHIGCLVHGYFNASIARPRVQNGYDVDSLTIGSKFTFRVAGLESLNGVLLITGVIDDKSLRKRTKNKTAEDINIEKEDIQIETNNAPQSSRKHKNTHRESDEIVPSKRRKDINDNQGTDDNSYYSDGSGMIKLVRKKTKKKKNIYN